jgi:MFS family permease
VKPVSRAIAVLLNLGHALDHMFLLIFATAVAAIAVDFGIGRWEDLMPFGAGAFVLFGLGSVPAGRLGDLWGRRQMMLVFYFGMGVSALLAATAQGPWTMALALTLLGAFASIYHPVGIPMLVQDAPRPGATIGISGLSGNLGVAVAALVTGALVKFVGWRAAFVVPGLFAIALGVVFARLAPHEAEPPSKRTQKAAVSLPRPLMMRALLVMTGAAATGALLFNFTTNGNGRLLAERFAGIVEDPAKLGAMLAAVYAVAAIAQVVVGRLIDRVPLKPLYIGIVLAQAPLLALAIHAQGWTLLALMLAFMVTIFGAIPFTDAMVVRYIDDRLRSRVAGIRLAVAFGISSAAVYALGPIVKSGGFTTLLAIMAGVSVVTALVVLWLPSDREAARWRRVDTGAPAGAESLPLAPRG